MIILSIDVGINNLALCLCNKDNLNIEILSWQIINLIDNSKCNAIKSCKCNAKFFINKGDLIDYYCNKHVIKEKNNNLLEKCKDLNSNNTSLINIGERLMILFDKYFLELYNNNNININDINHILIENQIGPIANRMKSLQAMISMYFILKKNCNIQYINSSNKLKYFIKKSENYKERKKKSIEITDKIILEKEFNILLNCINYNIKIINSDWYEFFKSNNKKDDLADCFLQLLYFNFQLLNK